VLQRGEREGEIGRFPGVDLVESSSARLLGNERARVRTGGVRDPEVAARAAGKPAWWAGEGRGIEGKTTAPGMVKDARKVASRAAVKYSDNT